MSLKPSWFLVSPVAMAAVLAASLGGTAPILAAEGAAKKPASLPQVVTQAVDYLRHHGQAEDGSFSRQAGPAVTALVLTGVLRHGVPASDPMVAKGLKYLETFVQEDGGIYHTGSAVQNYETCLALLCFTEANRDGRYDKLIKNADRFIKGLQWDEGEEKDQADFSYGGAGYGSHKRPDLSNTNFLIDALKASGNGPDDEAMKKALIFVSRCQNLESEHNASPFPAKNPDGGFYYTVAGEGNSQAGTTENGGLRSYGSMTYAGLKSMIFAGVGPDDPRVKAAVEWLSKHYSLEDNPGMGDAGLYYYYHTFAKALDALDQSEDGSASGHGFFTDNDGTKHDWRKELIAELAGRQQADGSWTNKNSRWLEGDPNLVTGYALLALSYCRPMKE